MRSQYSRGPYWLIGLKHLVTDLRTSHCVGSNPTLGDPNVKKFVLVHLAMVGGFLWVLLFLAATQNCMTILIIFYISIKNGCSQFWANTWTYNVPKEITGSPDLRQQGNWLTLSNLKNLQEKVTVNKKRTDN